MEFSSFETNLIGDGHIEIKATVPGADITSFMLEGYQTLMRAHGKQPSDSIPEMRRILLEDPKRSADDLNGIIKGYTLSRCVPYALDNIEHETITEPMFYCEEEPDLGTDLEIFIVALLKPTFTLTSYEPVEIELPKAVFSSEDIEEQLREFADQHASFVKSDDKSPLAMEDYAHIDLTISKNGKTIPQLSGMDNLFQCSYESMPVDFIDKIVGMEVGETRNFAFEGPKENAQGPQDVETYFASVTFTCHMDKIVPQITDEWFRENYPTFDSLDAFRAHLSSELEKKSEERLVEYKGLAVDYAIMDRLQGSIPDEIYEFVLENMSANFEASLKNMHMSKEEFFDQNDTDEQNYTTQMMLEARRVLRQGFSLDALFRGRKMELSDEDIHAFLSTMAEGREDELLAEMKDSGRMHVVLEEARRHKAHTWLVETAICKTVEV